MQEGHCDLLALVLGGQDQTCGEVLDVVTGGSDVAVQVLEDAAGAVGSNVVSVSGADCGQTGACSVGSDQLLVQILQRADVLSLDSDHILRSVEAVNDLSDQIGVLILQRVPPDDFDGLGDCVEISCGSLGGIGGFFNRCAASGTAAGAGSQGHDHNQSQQQSKEFFHFSYLSFQ